jgi:phosphatidate cytidylyltransferase
VSAFWSRIAVAAVGLPAVLGLVWLGGPWLLLLTLVAGAVGLHEYYGLVRPLRPLVFAGYVGVFAALVGASRGGPLWLLGGFALTLPLAFFLKGAAGTRQPTAVAVGSTVLGAAWIGLGLGHLLLLREIPEHGRLALIAVLVAIFADDTAAYAAGRLVGRHRMAPTISPGKTWEGFVFGSAAAIFVTWTAFYKQGFVDGWHSLVLGAAIAGAAPLGDLFESSLKRDAGAKDSGRLLGGHGGMLDRLDAPLFAGIAAYYVIAAFETF